MGSELTITNEQNTFTSTQVAALQQMGVQDASQGDLEVFFHQVQRTGLDPFAKQIYMIGRKTKVGGDWVTKQTIQVGIDGFRLIARRAADLHHDTYGEPEILWCGSDAVWHDVWLDPQHPPMAAKAVVQRAGGTFTGVATFAEYAGTRYDKKSGQQVVNSMWASKPAIMLGKCAEALALRKAFPQDLSGLYTSDEMQSADNADTHLVTVTADETPVEPSPSKEDCLQISRLLVQGGVQGKEQAAQALSALTGRDIQATSELTMVEAEQLLSGPELVVSRTQQALGAHHE